MEFEIGEVVAEQVFDVKGRFDIRRKDRPFPFLDGLAQVALRDRHPNAEELGFFGGRDDDAIIDGVVHLVRGLRLI